MKEAGKNRIKTKTNQVQMPIKFRGQEQGQGKRSQRLEAELEERITSEQRLEWREFKHDFLNICGRLWISFVS